MPTYRKRRDDFQRKCTMDLALRQPAVVGSMAGLLAANRSDTRSPLTNRVKSDASMRGIRKERDAHVRSRGTAVVVG